MHWYETRSVAAPRADNEVAPARAHELLELLLHLFCGLLRVLREHQATCATDGVNGHDNWYRRRRWEEQDSKVWKPHGRDTGLVVLWRYWMWFRLAEGIDFFLELLSWSFNETAGCSLLLNTKQKHFTAKNLRLKPRMMVSCAHTMETYSPFSDH
ncbi:hypothetical protein PsorP6_005061 [Peronosclerospora sorghi]|uniref:Uncharacterized protein n=1 Tax=Peronosclerospora sorghi TaxID=230839 RepID=A0ACC0W4R3_9STRA|nr:hypothetical protein PsorP6_005061 [Peronosclerospora sorghi]